MALGQYLSEHEVQEMHFSLAKGLWNYQRWGYPVRDSMPGAELWLWFQTGIQNPAKSWTTVSSILSGQFCASLNFVDNAVTVQPALSFRPEGLVDKKSLRNQSVFYAAVPHETVCTENLTPFKKLLPCFAKSGLASLLSAIHLFNSNFFSMAIDMRSVCKRSSMPCNEASIELIQSVSVVFNPPALYEGKQSWSFYKLFGSSFRQVCPLASSTRLLVDVSQNDSTNPHQFVTPPHEMISQQLPDGSIRRLALFDLKKMLADATDAKPVNIASQYAKEHIYGSDRPPVLYIRRSVTGYGVFSGGIVSRISNNSPKPVKVLYMDVIPWYLRIYTHTLTVTAGGRRIRPEKMFYQPARDRTSPHHLELVLTLTGNSVTQIEIQFDRSFLKWTEYSPDANHGVYAGSAILTARLDDSLNMTTSGTSSQDYHFVRIHSESLLIYLPTPDFSMPYNVICLVSTVVSLAFGPIHNLTTRRARVADGDAVRGESLFTRVKNYVNKKVRRRSPDAPADQTT
jgi:phosphatidylinositol glycan class T